MKKAISLFMALAILAVSVTACSGGGGIPDGTYEPIAVEMPLVGRSTDSSVMAGFKNFSITIKGNKFTLDADGVSVTTKYTYKDETLTLKEKDDVDISFNIKYDKDTLYWKLPGKITLELTKDGKLSKKDKNKNKDEAEEEATETEAVTEPQTEPAEEEAPPESTTDLKLPIKAENKTFASEYGAAYCINSESTFQKGERVYQDGAYVWQWTDIDVDVRSIEKVDDTVLYIKNDNTLWGFGSNNNGALGDGTGIDQEAPVKILDDVAKIYSEYSLTYAIKKDKSVWTWGSNDNYSPVLYESDVVDMDMDRDFLHASTGNLLYTVDDTASRILNVPVYKYYGSANYSYSNNNREYTLNGYYIDEDKTLWRNNGEEKEEIAKKVDDFFVIKDHLFYLIGGKLWGRGDNTSGILGDGTKVPRKDKAVEIAENVKSVREYGFLTTTGEYWSWTSEAPTPSLMLGDVAYLQGNIAYTADGHCITDFARWLGATVEDRAEYQVFGVKVPEVVTFG